MKVVVDIEANGLENPTEIWLIVCKDVDTGAIKIFRKVTQDDNTKKEFLSYAAGVTCWIGHNWLGYDYPVLQRLIGLHIPDVSNSSYDTLILSKLIFYSRSGHSVEDYGLEFNLPKGDFSDFSKWSQEMEDYCERDVEITHRIYLKYLFYINDDIWRSAIDLEQRFQLIVNDLHNNGFAYNKAKAQGLLERVAKDLSVIDKEISDAFPARLRFLREITPRTTKHGTLSKTDFRFVKDGDLSDYNGGPFCRCEWVPFNLSSPKQLVEVLINAGWSPVDKTKTHIELEREINHIKYQDPFDIRLKDLYVKLIHFQKYGWKVNENNLDTLPKNAPAPTRLLAKRILLEARRRTLTEQIDLVQPDGRIRGNFYGIGAWTHRMAHQHPNTANIAREFKEDETPKLLGKELRQLWIAPKGRLLVGVDAEGIQLRILAHYLEDKEFTRALVEGKKHDKSDPHSLNQRVLGSACKSRQAAKRFVYALLLGGGIGKLAQILETSKDETKMALDRLMARYQGWVHLKEHVLPLDGKRGWFVGIDGRHVQIPGETPSIRTHKAMSGYLQNGEAIIMKRAAILSMEKLNATYNLRCIQPIEREDRYPSDPNVVARCSLDITKFNSSLSYPTCKIVNIVHDELQFEVPNNMEIALNVAKIAADAIKEAGEFYKLKCPMAGSYYSESTKDYTIGTNWYTTH